MADLADFAYLPTVDDVTVVRTEGGRGTRLEVDPAAVEEAMAAAEEELGEERVEEELKEVPEVFYGSLGLFWPLDIHKEVL